MFLRFGLPEKPVLFSFSMKRSVFFCQPLTEFKTFPSDIDQTAQHQQHVLDALVRMVTITWSINIILTEKIHVG